MNEPLIISPDDSILSQIHFKPYHNAQLRRAEQFLPAPDEPQEITLHTPWGETLVCKRGDYLVSEVNNPHDRWPVEHSIFEETYAKLRSGLFTKKPTNFLVPLSEITGNPDRIVIVETLEGNVHVRSGDFFLARGPRGEIWPIPKEKVEQTMILEEQIEG